MTKKEEIIPIEELSVGDLLINTNYGFNLCYIVMSIMPDGDRPVAYEVKMYNLALKQMTLYNGITGFVKDFYTHHPL